jgi:hypothetical protein
MNGDRFDRRFDQANAALLDTSQRRPQPTQTRGSTSTLGSRPQRSKNKPLALDRGGEPDIQRRQAREALQSHVIVSPDGTLPSDANGSSTQLRQPPASPSPCQESGQNGNLPLHHLSNSPLPGHAQPLAPPDPDTSDWVHEAPDNLSNSSGPSNTQAEPIHANSPSKSPTLVSNGGLTPGPLAASGSENAVGFSESQWNPSGETSVWHRHQRGSVVGIQPPIANSEPIQSGYLTGHNTFGHPIGPLSAEVHVTVPSIARYPRDHMPPERTTSETVRDNVNSRADQQVQYVLDGPFEEELRVKLINVCLLPLCEAILV